MQLLSLLPAALCFAAASAHSAKHGVADLHAGVSKRAILPLGGWSLSATYQACPAGTFSCFTDQTGNKKTQNREENCCPAGTVPELFCGTYVNTGQPYACCPIDNPDCRGDVGKSDVTDKCANSGWALWHLPYGGGFSDNRGLNATNTTLNSFCCLPDQYGYYFPRFGQNAVGQCTKSNILPNGALPAVQDNNGDGSVAADGTQLSTLPKPAPTVAPTCDLVSYGWSLQKAPTDSCQTGFNQCSNYAGACCPTGLNCGTVVGDSEVPVCCPPENPDCRGDVQGLWPQLCADSSWALWHVNTNGNHFCCKPGQVGWNYPNNNTAVGHCGYAVPEGAMRSIYDYPGDGSTPGSYLKFPCDSNPAPNNTYNSMAAAILNPAPTLNPGLAQAAVLYGNGTERTTTQTYTVTACHAAVTDCPIGKIMTTTVYVTPSRTPVAPSPFVIAANILAPSSSTCAPSSSTCAAAKTVTVAATTVTAVQTVTVGAAAAGATGASQTVSALPAKFTGGASTLAVSLAVIMPGVLAVLAL